MNLDVTATNVFLYALITAIATGAGALPLYFMRRPTARVLGVSGAIAAGLMAGASCGLLLEGWYLGSGRTLIGAVAGVLAIRLAHRWLDGHDVRWGTIESADAKKIILILGVMTAHSFSEGVGVGVAFGGGESLGLFITAAIAVHNIPEGLAIALTMVPRGTSIRKAGLWGVFSSLPQPLMAVPAFLFVLAFAPVLPIGLGFAAGAMGWMIVSEMIPEARESIPGWSVAGVVSLSTGLMLAFQTLL